MKKLLTAEHRCVSWCKGGEKTVINWLIDYATATEQPVLLNGDDNAIHGIDKWCGAGKDSPMQTKQHRRRPWTMSVIVRCTDNTITSENAAL